MSDAINPDHYKKHSLVIEPIELCEGLGFLIGNCLKYCFRYKDKYQDKEHQMQDLQKAMFYARRAEVDEDFCDSFKNYSDYTCTLLELFSPQNRFVNAFTDDLQECRFGKGLMHLKQEIDKAIRELDTETGYKDC